MTSDQGPCVRASQSQTSIAEPRTFRWSPKVRAPNGNGHRSADSTPIDVAGSGAIAGLGMAAGSGAVSCPSRTAASTTPLRSPTRVNPDERVGRLTAPLISFGSLTFLVSFRLISDRIAVPAQPLGRRQHRALVCQCAQHLDRLLPRRGAVVADAGHLVASGLPDQGAGALPR